MGFSVPAEASHLFSTQSVIGSGRSPSRKSDVVLHEEMCAPQERNPQRNRHTVVGTVGSEAGVLTREARKSKLEEKHQPHGLGSVLEASMTSTCYRMNAFLMNLFPICTLLLRQPLM